jgi:hypothetical protein
VAKGDSLLYPSYDFSSPRQFKAVVQNIRNVYEATPHEIRQTSKHWYDRVNEAVGKGVHGSSLTGYQGAGLVAAVSPNMDFERSNIDAFHEMRKMTGRDWAAIHDSVRTQKAMQKENLPVRRRNAAREEAGIPEHEWEPLPHPRVGRSAEAAGVLKGLSLAKAPDTQLVKAHRIIEGEDWEDVLNRRTAPKTNAFAHNIHRPDLHTRVTIDGRAHDIGINRLYPWTYSGRGISSADTKGKEPTRYEHFENAYRQAAGHLDLLPHQLQAITWEGGKYLEKASPTKTGAQRQKGVERVGQPYVGRRGLSVPA